MMTALSFKRLARKGLLRLLRAARAEEIALLQDAAKSHMQAGDNCVIDLTRIFWSQSCFLTVGEQSHLRGEIYFEREGAQLEIGTRTYFSSMISCADKISIGDDVLISSGGFISDHQSHALDFPTRRRDVVDGLVGRKDWSHVPREKVVIENKVWIGWGVTILKGVTIGEGAVIGANSVVTRNIPPYVLAVGNPARVVREILDTSR